ncbi:hypothetical protein C1646_761978 [Rhizophagus diaphanus]|nr:hypothetical protein C1646_761978 [Rhizophagus diaphanus] [Rhizophagus sp. MUCL 43196]
MSYEYYQEVIIDLEKLFTTEIGYDVIIFAGENKNTEELHAHSNILSTRSQYFCTAFSNELAEKKNGKFIFKKPNVSPELFKIILRFIYCGKIDFIKLQCPEILKLLAIVDELGIQSLISCIQEYLIKHHDEFLQQNPIEILETVYQHESFEQLWNHCLEKICEDPRILFNSEKFINLKSSLLELLLKRDDLYLEEIIIWDGLLKWGVAQNPSISKDEDITKLKKDDITIMKKTLHKFIPLIRFYHISSEDFLDKVYPLKDLLPEDLLDGLLKFHIASSRKSNVNDIQRPRKLKCNYDSILIENQHFANFANWIDKKDSLLYNIKNNPYNFNLLYRASRDGYTPEAFHSKCDNKGATIVVAKISDSDQIIGGYNSLQWDSSDQNRSTFDSFIFLYTDRKNAKLSYSNGDQFSIRNIALNGPTFGGGNDLYCDSNGTWRSNGSCSYPKIDGMRKGIINVNDYEVFQVILKRKDENIQVQKINQDLNLKNNNIIVGKTKSDKIKNNEDKLVKRRSFKLFKTLFNEKKKQQ